MNTVKLSSLFFLIALMSFHTVMAQSLDSLIAEAARNNPQLRSLQMKVRTAEYKSKSVNTYPAPTVGIEFSQVPSSSANIWNDALSNNLSISQMFMLGGKVEAMTDVENKNVLAEKDGYTSYAVNLASQIKMSYYTLWLIDRKMEIQKKTISILRDMSESTVASLTVNRTSQADALLIKSETAVNELQLSQLQRQRDAQAVKLNKLLDRELSASGITPARELPQIPAALDLSRLEGLVDDINPDLARMDKMIAMNKSMITSNDRGQIPDLMVQAMLMRMPKGMILTSASDLSMLSAKTEYMYSLMFSVTLPFAPWSKSSYEAKKEELLSGIEGIRLAKEDMSRDMKSKVKEALIKFQSALESERLYTETVLPLSEQAAASQRSAFGNGSANITAVLDANRMQLMNEMNRFMAQADARMALAEVEMMTGNSLPIGEVEK
jgi:outer membrane protein, heavy metal efflux system